jgi:hypothetical protein
MLPTKFRFIWQSGFRKDDLLEISQSETRIVCGCWERWRATLSSLLKYWPHTPQAGQAVAVGRFMPLPGVNSAEHARGSRDQSLVPEALEVLFQWTNTIEIQLVLAMIYM